MEPIQSKSVPDPTSRILDEGDNTADSTQLSAPSLGEIRGGRSTLDYLDDAVEAAEEADAEVENHVVYAVEDLPGSLVLKTTGALIFLAGIQVGVLGGALYRALT